MRDGDVLLIPKKSGYIAVNGQVFNPTAVSYRPGRSARWYLSQAGGLTQLANKKAVFVIKADGSVLAAKNNSGFLEWRSTERYVAPGRQHRRTGSRAAHRQQKLAKPFPGWAVGCFGSFGRRLHSSLMCRLSIWNFVANVGECDEFLALAVLSLCALAVCAQEPDFDDSPSKKDRAARQHEKHGKRKTPDATTEDSSTPPVSGGRTGISSVAKDVLMDQKAIWTSPAKLRFADADWLIPTAGIAAGLFSTDSDIGRHLSNNPQTISHYKNISTAGAAALIGGAGALWLASFPSHNAHWRESGFLAGEAAIAAVVPIELMKYSLRRERPYQGDGSGPFFSGGTSFPSEHAAASWAVAGVLAHEYPGAFPKFVFYSLASLVTYSRVKGRQHFPSDVFIGSIVGNLVAQSVYTRHHDPDLGGEAWSSIRQIVRGDGYTSPSSMGSPYVPLDSWIYESLDRLSALGVIDSGFVGLRPWTRMECARLVNEAADQATGNEENSQAAMFIRQLQQEFAYEISDVSGKGNDTFRVESVYSRTEHISGAPLTDGYTFGQTQINDFGRPYGEGWNNVTGTSLYLTHGRWVGYVRGEFQASPEIPALSLNTRQIVQAVDHYPAAAARHPAPCKK